MNNKLRKQSECYEATEIGLPIAMNLYRAEMERGTFSVREAARYLGIGRSSVYNLIYQNKIIAIKIGGRRLITKKELFGYLDDLQAEAIERIRKGVY